MHIVNYSVPIPLNGEEYNLQAAYDFTAEQWSIQGTSQSLTKLSACFLGRQSLSEGSAGYHFQRLYGQILRFQENIDVSLQNKAAVVQYISMMNYFGELLPVWKVDSKGRRNIQKKA